MRQETENDLRVFKCDVQQLKKAKMALIAMVTKKKGTIKYLQSQLNEYICNNARHFFTAYNAI